PQAIREFTQDLSRCVIKSLTAFRGQFLLTQAVRAEHLSDDVALRVAPAIYQELIPGTVHYRVQVFCETIATVRLRSADLDWRTKLNIPAELCVLPDDCHARLREVLRRLELRMGIFDLKETDAGELVWLEVNPQGQFLFLEGMSAAPLLD